MKRQHPTEPIWECSRCGKMFVPNNKIRNQAIRRDSEFVYCSRNCLNLRRLHPTNSNLFFCFNCKTYKTKDQYDQHRGGKYGIQTICRDCHTKQEKYLYDKYPERYREVHRRSSAKLRKQYPQRYKDSSKKYYLTNREKCIKRSVEYHKKHRNSESSIKRRIRYKKRIVDELRDNYVKHILNLTGVIVTDTTLALKRQQLTMKRTLKQFKKWRKENEPDYSVIHGQQRTDETVNEGNRRC